MNKCFMVGRLTRDPETRTTNAGKQVCSFAIAVDNPYRKDSQGNRMADFFNVQVWGQRAESAQKYLVKGQLVGVAGRIEVRQYDDRDGNKRTSVDIVADDFQGYTKPRTQDGEQRGSAQGAASQHFDPGDDLPF